MRWQERQKEWEIALSLQKARIAELEEALQPFVVGLNCKMLGCETENTITEFCPNGCIIHHGRKVLDHE